MRKKKIGILGGSFDPVHFGHLNLGIALKEAKMLDEVLVVPAQISPFKEGAPPAVSAEHRLALLKLALAEIPEFRILDWELQNLGPSYTIDTIRKLKDDKSLELNFLIGEDNVARFFQWKEAEEIIRLAPLLIGARKTESSSHLPKNLQQNTIQIPLFDISSTQVRKRLSEGKYCGHLVPAVCLKYIYQHNLY